MISCLNLDRRSFHRRDKRHDPWLRQLILIPIFILLTGCAAVSQQSEPLPQQTLQTLNTSTSEAGVEALLLSAKQHFERFGSNRDSWELNKALRDIIEAKRLEPDNPLVNALYAVVLTSKIVLTQNTSLLDELESAYRKAQQLAPTLVGELPHPAYVTAEIYWSQFVSDKPSILMDGFYYNQIISLLQEAIKEKPNFPPAHLFLGKIYFLQDHKELALFELSEAVRQDPDSADAYYLMGDIYSGNIHRNEVCYDHESANAAVKAFKQTIRLLPQSYTAHYGLSNAYLHLGQYELAVLEAEWTLKLKENPAYHQNHGDALLYTDRTDEAIRELRVAQSQQPKKTKLQAEVGVALMLSQRYEEATEAYQRYLDSDQSPNLYYVLFYYYSLRHTDRNTAAVDLLQRYLLRSDQSWESQLIRFHLAELSTEQLHALATNDCEHGEARFYEGYRLLLEGHKQRAKQIFEEYLDYRLYCFTETKIALMWLRNMNEGEQ